MMPRFKAPAPIPPTPTARKIKSSDIHLLQKYDDLCRNSAVLMVGAEEQFLAFVGSCKEWRKKWLYAETERQRTSVLLTERDNELAGKERLLKQARELFNEEQKRRCRAEEERDQARKQLEMIKELLLADGGKTINNETLDRIKKIDLTNFGKSRISPKKRNMKVLMEDSAESLLDASDLSFEESREDILGESRLRSGNARNRRSSEMEPKKRRSCSTGRVQLGAEKLVTKTTVTVAKNGEAHAESVIETYPIQTHLTMDELKEARRKSRLSRDLYEPSAPPVSAVLDAIPTPNAVKRTFSNAGSSIVSNKLHSFQKKKIMGVERCIPCGKRIKFGKTALKCISCAAVCHVECKLAVPLPCIPNPTRTPVGKTAHELVDYAPPGRPMVPALIVHCVKEVESRGLLECGIYRVSGQEAESTEIMDKFMACKGVPKLDKHDIHSVTSCMKKFLRSLREPVIPTSLLPVFVDAASSGDESSMYQALSELPQPNRETMAYLIIHLKTVAANESINKMSADNLATVFGPTLLGFASKEEPSWTEVIQQKCVMKALLNLPDEYLSPFLFLESDQSPKGDCDPSPNIFDPSTGGPARRTRSRQLTKQHTFKKRLFQSPIINY